MTLDNLALLVLYVLRHVDERSALEILLAVQRVLRSKRKRTFVIGEVPETIRPLDDTALTLVRDSLEWLRVKDLVNIRHEQVEEGRTRRHFRISRRGQDALKAEMQRRKAVPER